MHLDFLRLACATAITLVLTSPLSAQDIVMRRPLPNAKTTPPLTPDTTPTPTIQPTLAHGWQVDCAARDTVCYQVASNPQTNTITKSAVDDAACGVTQTAAQQTLAHSALLVGLGEGVDATHGLETCGQTPTPTSTVVGHGWRTDCVARTTSCMMASRASDGQVTTAEVNASLCSASQDVEAAQVAKAAGLIGLGESIDANYIPAACGPTRTSEPPAETAHGWIMNCQFRTRECVLVTKRTGGDGFVSYSSTYVNASACPTTQTGAQNALAHRIGAFGIGEGVDATHGLEMCSEPKPNYRDNASGFCNIVTGKTTATCVRDILSDPDDGKGPIAQLTLGSSPEALATCAAAQSEEWTRYIEGRYNFMTSGMPFGILRPADVLGYPGRNCGPQPKITYAKSCAGEARSQCHRIGYRSSFGFVMLGDVENADASACGNVSQGPDDRMAVAQSGLLSPDTPDSTCKAPLYASQGQCKFDVTYDIGWPLFGQSHVNSDFIERCYEISGAETPATATATPVATAKCTSQTPSARQEALLRSLEPVFHDPRTLDRTCNVSVVVNHVDYVTASVPTVEASGPRTMVDIGTRNGTGKYYQQQVGYSIPYACTDDDAYFYDRSAFASRLSTLEVPRCTLAHLQHLAQLRIPANSLRGQCGRSDEHPDVCSKRDSTLTVADDTVNERITVTFTDIWRVPYSELPN